MSNLHHAYVTAHGSYPSGSWLGESAQIGLRLAFVLAAAAPDKGAIFAPEVGGTIGTDFGSQTGTNGTLSKTFTARVGATGSAVNLDAGMQIDIAEDVWKFLNAIKTHQSNLFRWTHVKISAVDEAGATPVASSIYTFTSPLTGGGTSSLPPQVAMALSTRANLVGRRGRGRVYIPALGGSVLSSDGTISATPANSLRASFKTLIDDLQSLPGSPIYIPIVSVMSNDSDTAVRPVEVRTGSRLDTIQSRRRQVEEVYTTTAL